MVRDIDSGKLMVVSDLHGNGHDFRQVLKVYRKLKSMGDADFLVFLGELVHAYPGKQKDESLGIVEELIGLGANRDGGDVICLLGNHEFVHIYHIPLFKGHLEFTSWFENRIRRRRAEIVRFFTEMPLMARTKGGVLLSHAGASDCYHKNERFDLEWLKQFRHRGKFKAHLESIDKYEPRIGSEFMDTAEGDFLWDALMNGNERQYGGEYFDMVENLLLLMSRDRLDNPLRVLVSGHIGVDYGAETLGGKKLRLCSSAGCLRDLEKKYLLISAEKEYGDSQALLERCFDLF